MPDSEADPIAGAATVAVLLAEAAGLAEPPPRSSRLTALGLGSMAAARLWLEVRERLGVDFPFGWLAEDLSVGEFCSRVADEGVADVPPDVPSDPRTESFPLTPIQQSYVTGSSPELTADPVGCHQYLEFVVEHADHHRIEAAWRQLVERHDMLRAVLTPDGRQRVLPVDLMPSFVLPVHDLRLDTREDAVRAQEEVRRRLHRRRTEPDAWPPFAVETCLLPGERAVVHVDIDCLVADGHSIALLLDQWSRLYHDPGAELPRPALSGRDCVVAVTRTTDRRASELAFWLDRIGDAPPGPALGRGARGTRVALEDRIGPSTWSAVQDHAAALGVSPSSLLLEVFAGAVARSGADEPFSLVLTTSARAWLPREAAQVVGPFTSSAIVVVDPARAADELAETLHRQVWDALAHASVSGVEVLRELRGAGPRELCAVFTSLLDLGPDGRMDAGFASGVVNAVSRTSGITLDSQVWAEAGGLRFRWDCVPDGAGAMEAAFARFTNGVRALAQIRSPAVARPANALQQAYLVARVDPPAGRPEGCQIYKCVHVDGDVDLTRLEAAVLGVLGAHEVTRSWIDQDGTVRTSSVVPCSWRVPVIDLDREIEPAAALLRLREDMTGRAFPLGAWPHFDVRVTVGAGRACVHCAFDIAIFDAPTVHFLVRDLMTRYHDPASSIVPGTSAGTVAGDVVAAKAHWERRESELLPGAHLPAGPAGRARPEEPRLRLTHRQRGWRNFAAAAAARDVLPDALLLTVFTQVLAAELGTSDFAVPMVRWPGGEHVPGESTELSWISAAAPDAAPLDQARRITAEVREDVSARAVEGLRVLRRSMLRGDGGYPVVYSSVVDLTRWPSPPGVADGSWLSVTPGVALDCVATADGDELVVSWDAADGLPGGWLNAAFARFSHAVARIFDDVSRPAVGVLDTGDLSGDEYRKIVYGWNDTDRPFAMDRLAHQGFQARAAEGPEVPALLTADGVTTRGDLNAWANRIARRLTELEVRPGSVVGVCARRGPAMIAAVLGALKAGCAYTPLEPAWPAARAAAVLNTTDATVVLSTVDTTRWDEPRGVTVLDVGDGPPATPEPDLERRGSADGTAYVIFTSGSTGTPKGVAVSHRAVSNLVSWCTRTYGFGPGDLGLCVTSLGFDLSVFDLFGILGAGGALYLANEHEQRDPALLLDVLLERPVTFWNSAPTTLGQLASLLPESGTGVRHLRLVFLSGDYTPLSLPDQVRAAFPDVRIVSLGGATEATVWSNHFEIGQIDPEWRSVPYGEPIDNARYHILDDRMLPCPPEVEGDLFIAGECLAQGYFGAPGLTAERFVASPFGVPGDRMYRTGDRAVYRPDGTIVFRGRADGQVKVRGFRVEPGEIEHRLRQHPAVREAVVLVRDNAIVAYVVPAGRSPEVRELRDHAAETLPDYMVPNFVEFVDAFPATENGKLDRGALPVPRRDTPPSVRDEVAEVFADVLGVGSIDPDQDIWDQGATSFTLVQVSNVLQRRYGSRIPLSVVVAEPTVDRIARHFAEAAPQSGIDFFSASDRARFKAGNSNSRPAADQDQHVPLPRPRWPAELHRRRATRREFDAHPVPLATFTALLGLLRESTTDETRRRLYPSAGETYGVQVYVHIRPDGVEGIAPGVYYYRAEEHRLEPVGAASALDRNVHFYYNRPVFDAASFELFLVGQTNAITPVYGEDGERYLAVEAGHAGQLLLLAQEELGIGLCEIGALSFERVALAIGADDGHRFLLGFLGGPVARRLAEPILTTPDPVVIVGMSGHYPDAGNPDELWRNLAAGRRSLRLPTRPALDREVVGGYLDTVEEFDSLLFRLSPAEARALDPQLRLVLQSVWECLENAGHTPESLRRLTPRIGVFVGVMWHDHEIAGAGATGSDIPNRISHFFDFAGPSVTVDTSCSSALTAMHLAVESMRRGECDGAVVAAVNLVLHPRHIDLLRSWGLVADGAPAAAAFDAESRGWSPGEGCGVVLLRRRTAAVSDGDTRYGEVAATWMDHAGGPGRFGDPSIEGMSAAMRATLDRAGVVPAEVGYVECAAAGSPVADAAEIAALSEVFADSGAVPIGTVKHNIGHLEAAAGMSQVTKVLCQLREGRLAPTPAASVLSPLVEWERAPVRVVNELESWTGPRLALVNAIGAGGSSAHVLLRAELTVPEPACRDIPAVVPVSAASAEALDGLVRRLCARLADDPPPLADLAFTLQTGRAQLAHRLVVRCRDTAELLSALEAHLSRDTHMNLRAAVITPSGRTITPVDVAAAVAAWFDGATVDWSALWTTRGRRIALPTYPFARSTHGTGQATSTGAVARLVEKFAAVSGIPADRIDPHAPLEQYGVSSFLVTRLNAALAEEHPNLPATLFFEHRTLAEIAPRLVEPAAAPVGTAGRAETTDDIAIIGIAGRYPGARDLDELWRVLRDGEDLIGPLPRSRGSSRWPVELMHGSFLDEVDRFDPLLFGIAPRDADLMDPQERLFLEVVWETLDDAGYPRSRLAAAHGGRVGVFAATMYAEYQFLGVERSMEGTPTSTDSSVAGIANRVSHAFDLRGPSMTVDTMCSSSLTALHLAVSSLRLRECELAVAGGVNLSLHPNKFIEQARLRMTSSDHRCRAFAAGADGFAPGEGIGAVLLKRLPDALAAGDRIHAVVKGTAVNHGGRTNGYTVPNPVAQAEVITAALAAAGVEPSTVDYVEAHGTGTALGDPVEIAGLERAFAGVAPGSCAIGSVKSNLGHLEGAAGILGLTKVVLQLRHEVLVPTLHVARLNERIDWERSPFRPQRTTAPWPRRDGKARRACVSSFGAGGSNAHVVVQEAHSAVVARPQDGPRVIVLSARTAEALRLSAARLADAVRDLPDGAGLADVAYTLRAGREHLAERLAVVVADRTELADVLRRFASGEEEHVFRGRASGPVDAPSPSGPVERAELWVRGGCAAWSEPDDEGCRIVALPSYPFARHRHWLPDTPLPPDTPPSLPVLHTKAWRDKAVPPLAPVRGEVLCLHTDRTAGLATALARRFGGQLRACHIDEFGGPVSGFSGCVDLTDLDDGDRSWRTRLGFLREMVSARAPMRLIHVVSGLLEPSGPTPRLAGARLAGFVFALDAESSALRACTVDVDLGDGEDAVVDALRAEWSSTDGVAEVCYRRGRRLLPELAPLVVPPATRDLVPGKVYVVTGGTGGIGRLVAGRLVERGATAIALLGRRPIPPRADWDRRDLDERERSVVNLVRELENSGAEVALHCGPLDDRDAVGAFLTGVRRDLGPIGGVVHCAGRMSPVGSFAGKDPAAVAEVLAPKIDGTNVVTELCAPDRPDFVISFSSAAAVLPELAAGVADYAAANAYLVHHSSYLARTGVPGACAVTWPSWGDTGMRGGRDADGTLTAVEGLRVLDALMAHPVPFVHIGLTVAPSDVPDWLVEVFARTVGLPAAEVDPDAPFTDLGIDSVLIADLVAALEARLGRPVAPATVLEHPTLAGLAARLGAADAPVTTSQTEVRPLEAGRVAVIGMSCRFPGAPDVEAFWRVLSEGHCTVTEVPPSRWDIAHRYRSTHEPGTSISKWGGYLEDIETFDNDYFGMSDDEAACLDPAIRLMLEGAAVALADAGYRDDEIAGRDVGVFVGARLSDYRTRIGARAGTASFGGDQNFLAARVSKHYDLAGPSLVVDSACSSALVAVQLAMRSLADGESELAVVGGVDVLLDHQVHVEFSAAKALSRTGRCRVFDRDADGFVPGEGCGVLLLKSLERALADGDRVRAVIDGVAVGNDGRTVGLTTPNPTAQAAVIRRALRVARTSATEIGMIEAHGTGTRIGDPVELQALTAVFREAGAATGRCAIGSVKSNIGHLLSAAGVAGLAKAILAVERKTIPPTLFCDVPNPRFDFAASPFHPAVAASPWPDPARRVAGVSAFGLGGTNAHAVVSGLDRTGSCREPLPPPRFRRRRRWLDPSGAGEVELVTSLLDISFGQPATR